MEPTLTVPVKRHITAFLLLFFACAEGMAQTNIIDSTSTTGGSFQNLTNTFAANGWTSINAATNKWFVGTVATCTGSKGAYIGTTAANNNYTTTTTNVSHFYRSVTFPAGETCINLSFIWKANGEVSYDGISVYLGAVGGPVPVANAVFSSTDAGATQLGASLYDVQTTCGRVSITVPASFAGTTRYLVFSWKNDNSAGGGTGGTVDNIGLVSDVPAVPSCAGGGGAAQNPPKTREGWRGASPPAGGGCAPPNTATNIGRCSPTLSWTAPAGTVCNAPTMYYVYFGPALNPPLVDSTTGLSYQLGTLSSNTSYYWKIIPKNSMGLATGCTQRIFTTDAATCAVSPGGIGTTNLTGWFKADALTAGNLASWTSTYPTGGSAITVTDPSAPYSQATNSSLAATSAFNYNQYVSFAGNDITAGNNRFLYSTANYSLMTNSDNAADQSSFFTVSQDKPGGANDAIVYWIPSSGNYGLQCRGIARMAIGSGLGLNTNSSRDPVVVNGQTVFSYTGNRSSATSMTGYYNGSVIPAGTASESQGGTGLAFGVHIATNTPTFIEPFQGDEAEHVFFNTTLTTAMVNRVHSYLAVKYGITLSTSYAASGGTTIFTTAAPYNNNIIGIGRDDVSALLQKQSHNMDDSVRIYAGTLAATNAANIATFSSDQSFVMAGATTGPLNSIYASASPKPAGIYSRLEREWQVTKTNYGQTFSIDIKLSPHGAPLAVTASDLRLLVDNTGNFANAAVYASGGGLTISYSYPVITVSGISNTQIPNNSTMNITIGSVSVLTPLPVELASFTAHCSNKNILLGWSTASENGNAYFTVERATDGAHYTAIAQINGKGQSSQPVSYAYSDANLDGGTYYYRLQLTDTKGSTSYSPAVLAKQDCSPGNGRTASLVVYPNPVYDNAVQLEYTSAKDERVVVQLNNSMGQACLEQPLQVHAGKNNTAIAVDKLSPGIYFMRVVSSQQKSDVIKLVVNRTP